MAGIYRNQDLGLISLSSDGTTRITIADKNLGATQVYNSGDTLSESNAGKYYQRGNNYGFPFTGSVTTSSTQVNAQNYGPGNYYSSSTFIIRSDSPYDRSSVQNDNLWGDTTDTNAARQGPCTTGFHVPKNTERQSIYDIWTALGGGSSDGTNFRISLKLPPAGFRSQADSDVRNQGTTSDFWSSSIHSSERAYSIDISAASIISGNNAVRSRGYSIRPFKNEAVKPDRTWTKLYGDDILPPFIKWFINNGNYYYFKDAPIHISGLALDKSSISLTTVGQTEQLTATITPADAVEKTVTWSSSDTSIATVDNTGLVTCVTPGECTITATCGGFSATCSIDDVTPLCFTANTAGSTVRLHSAGGSATIETSRDGTNRSSYTIEDVLTLSNIGDKIYFRNSGTSRSVSSTTYFQFVMGGSIAASGDVTSIVRKGGTKTLGNFCLRHLFRNCTSLTSAPLLPATTLGTYCYYNMFNGCTSLETAPELPATSLSERCYNSMFAGCTSLNALPKLPALSLPSFCYAGMFSDCSNIKISATQTGEYQTPYRIPTTGTGSAESGALNTMFSNTGGTFTSNPSINTTYYTSNTVV